MKSYYEVKTLGEALTIAKQYENICGTLLVQNVYKSDINSNCVVIKYERVK